MGCRIKENPTRTFDFFLEASCPATPEDDPLVLRQFPEEFEDQESIQMLPRFCFPFDVERGQDGAPVQNFTFALTDMDGNQRFGFCRLAPSARACLCILSYLPWFELFYKILNTIADHLAKQQLSDLEHFLTALYSHPVPPRGSPMRLEFGQCQDQKPSRQDEGPSYFIAPDLGGLPSIPENRNLTEFVVAVDVPNMLQLYGSLLCERRILLTASKLSTLTACILASSGMLYPMSWQHIFIPTLPPHLLDYCCAPMPYLIGVHSSLMEKVRAKALEDVIILNIDTNTLESPFRDLEKLPGDVVSLLKLQLRRWSSSPGAGVAHAFLQAQALLFGSYRQALLYTPGQPISFSQEAFLSHKAGPMREFLHSAVHLQLFKQFIDERLEKLNAGEGFSDMFEQEITSSGMAAGTMKSYQLWVENFKKGGGALIQTVRTKANPAMRNMYRYAKGQARLGLKEMRSRLLYKTGSPEQRLQRGASLHLEPAPTPASSSRSERLQRRLPITHHFGKSRPRRPQPKPGGMEPQTQRCVLRSEVQGQDREKPADQVELDTSFPEPEDLDLLGEIFEALSLVAPGEGGALYGTRSLDLTQLGPSQESLNLSLDGPSRDWWALPEEEDDEEDECSSWNPSIQDKAPEMGESPRGAPSLCWKAPVYPQQPQPPGSGEQQASAWSPAPEGAEPCPLNASPTPEAPVTANPAHEEAQPCLLTASPAPGGAQPHLLTVSPTPEAEPCHPTECPASHRVEPCFLTVSPIPNQAELHPQEAKPHPLTASPTPNTTEPCLLAEPRPLPESPAPPRVAQLKKLFEA
ncbi:DENN domain-containing protein 1C isoform X3 [Alligator mississippiensis]|uniref:DENN domain-containing protein 1C isoform X3 n=1 Tax=Alligator mississippiensis TaxID=8496 RepID=UPI002877C409|nr:DENN domain-containing protein 1C isoform X3 [Alligator mississippiensis]